MNETRCYARIARYTTIKSLLDAGVFSRQDADELLSGCLDPEDESTRFDDSALLNENIQKAIELIQVSEDPFKGGECE